MRLSLLMSFTLTLGAASLPTFAAQLSPVESMKKKISNMPNDQAFKIGLRGFGQCKIIPDWVMGVRTYNVKTAQQPGVIGNGAVVVNVGATQYALGIAYAPPFETLLRNAGAVFPIAQFAGIRQADPKINAAIMFKNAVAASKCGSVSSNQLPQVQHFEMKNFDAETMKDKFSFYMDPISKKLECTTKVVSKPIFNSQTCQYVQKDVPVPTGFCEKFYLQFAKTKRENISSGLTAAALPAVAVAALTPAVKLDLEMLNMNEEAYAVAEAALVKPRLFSVIDPSAFMVDKASLATNSAEAIKGAVAVKYYDALPQAVKSGLSIDPAFSGLVTAVKANAQVASLVNAAVPIQAVADGFTAQNAYQLNLSEIHQVLDAEVQPIKKFLPNSFSIANIGCAAMMMAPAQSAAAFSAQ